MRGIAELHVGKRVFHSKRGAGVVLTVNRKDDKPVRVQFDNGEVHTYSEQSALKFATGRTALRDRSGAAADAAYADGAAGNMDANAAIPMQIRYYLLRWIEVLFEIVMVWRVNAVFDEFRALRCVPVSVRVSVQACVRACVPVSVRASVRACERTRA